MHVLIPFASARSDGCQAALPDLQLPHLDKLLARLKPQDLDAGDEYSWSTPHERALAKALGLPHADGQIAWAAVRAQEFPQLHTLTSAWAFVNLCHWQASTFEVSMRQIPMVDLTVEESDSLQQAMAPFFEQDGITLQTLEPGCWLAHSELFANLRSASPERVQGRNLAPWMPSTADAGQLIRLVSEMQMLLYTHPVNDARQARGALTANALWFSGTGALPQIPATQTAAPHIAAELRSPALAEDWPTWISAWQQLDASLIRDLLAAHAHGESLTLTLCGERHAQTWLTQPLSLLQKLKAQFATQPTHQLLKNL